MSWVEVDGAGWRRVHGLVIPKNFEAKVRRGSNLGSLLFLIYANDLSYDLLSNAKLFADDTFLSLKLKTLSAKNLNNDQAKISYWTFQ